MRSFAHLHLHTEYSLLDGMGRIPDYMARAREYGMEHLAITDHGVMYGVVDWYKAARANDLHPILGIEAYLAPNRIEDRDKSSYHLLLLAENERGYRNLLKLASRASLDGFYYKPRVDLDMLNGLRDGIIATSACLGGPVANNFLNGRDEEAVRMAGLLKEMFGPAHFYVEIQDHGIEGQHATNPQLVELARRLDLPLVASNDVHYVDRGDAPAQELLVCIQTNTTLSDPKRMRMESDELYFKSPDEMWRIFGDVPEALENTLRIAERCNVDLDFGRLHLPDPGIPDGMSAHQYLTRLCWEGLPRCYPEVTDEVRQRLDYELDVIEQTGFSSYMLIVRDFAQFARQRRIPFGVRGSAAASIVLFTLAITDIDPLANRLVFERFLNIERREMPDIDMDFADNRRGEVIDYVANKYGHDRVAQIITFGTMGAKASLRDTGRAMGWAYNDVDRVARLIPPALNMSLDRALQESSELRRQYESDPRCRDLVDHAKRLEGISRHAGTHAAGVVIASDPLVEHLPLQRPARSEEGALPTTQFTMETVAEIGLLKMDFLGLANLTILGEAVDVIRETTGVELDPKDLPDGDGPTYQMLSKGETFGVFQLESAGMRRYIRELRPGTVAELAAMVALYRPGPMQHIPTYCRAKHGQEPIRYPHPDLAEILDETYGVIVYQDQVLLIARKFAGYTLGEADIMRKAMGKKIPEKMAAERARFIQGAREKGYGEGDAQTIFNLIEPFAGYAFNKAHAVCYGTISYQTAYLKANFPAEYMTAVLRLAPSHPSGAAQRVAAAVAECQKLGIPVLPPDVNRSGVNFNVERTAEGSLAIRFGLAIVKNAGEMAVASIVAARDALPGRRFASFEQFCDTVDWGAVNRRVAESLIKCGALDAFSDRTTLLALLEPGITAAQSRQKAARRGQIDLFALVPEAASTLTLAAPAAVDSIPQATLLAWEKEHLGLYLSAHPLNAFIALIRQGVFVPLAEIDEETAGQQVEALAMITGVRKINTKTNRTMAVCQLEDQTGTIEMVVFPDLFEAKAELLTEDSIVRVTARVDQRNDRIQFVAQSVAAVSTVEEAEPVMTSEVRVRLPGTCSVDCDVQLMHRMRDLFDEFPGSDVVYLTVPARGREVVMRAGVRVDWCPDLATALEELVGADGVSVDEVEVRQTRAEPIRLLTA
ncbi:MAG TPA: DNA polymerase III subunit alpha [Thermomicrobiaceae bacterium]|nr:DNA polymerase III subunit alpha [Thermomicrobiaceae bacterium]